MNESQLLEDSLKLEIRKTDGSDQLAKLYSARNLTNQLAYTQRTLKFFQARGLNKDINRFVADGTKLANLMKSLLANEKQLVGSGWNNITALKMPLFNLMADIQTIRLHKNYSESTLRSFASSFVFFEDISIPALQFSSLVSELDVLKSTSIGESKEVWNAEQSLVPLEGLHYASMRSNGELVSLLGKADDCFQMFFEESSEWTITLLYISIVCIAAGVLCAVFVWFIFHKDWRPLYCDKARTSEVIEKEDKRGECRPLEVVCEVMVKEEDKYDKK
uniref:Uncharacterized protein n=1 Tax=Caenorhabditis japonica TaxID=281687 RepID=A0A8R1EP05_CAEJA